MVQCSSWGRYLPPAARQGAREAGELGALRGRTSRGSEGPRLCPSVFCCAVRNGTRTGKGRPGFGTHVHVGMSLGCLFPGDSVLPRGLNSPPWTSRSSEQDSG